MELHLRFCQLVFGIILPSCLLLYECRKLEGYKFPVYSTELCPRNQTEWNERSVALNCTDKNGYLCLPNENITELLEFCYEGPFIWIEENICLFLRKGLSALFSYSCIGFQFGCPNSSFPSHELYKNPYCTLIGHGCFLAEPSCQRSTSTTYLENVTEHIQSKSREWALVGTTFGVFIVTFFCLTCFIFIINGKGYQILKQNTNEENNKKEELPPSSSPNTLVFNEISAEGHKMCKLTNDDENHDKEKLSPSHSTTALVLNEIRAEEYQNNDEENKSTEELSPSTTPHSLVCHEISAEGIGLMFKEHSNYLKTNLILKQGTIHAYHVFGICKTYNFHLKSCMFKHFLRDLSKA
ncbi:uncharacterized protein LOC128170765 [Crassostrea angulata]|uniref:uncharacterized protein LOC128170765 n=1 Tax=Magallana angulata TaxID=2784310 RepID=UPI0022B21835|nr:uncharacterized protein LOC128170765 [Crassostrea angulata]